MYPQAPDMYWPPSNSKNHIMTCGHHETETLGRGFTFTIAAGQGTTVAAHGSRLHVQLTVLVALPHGTPASHRPCCLIDSAPFHMYMLCWKFDQLLNLQRLQLVGRARLERGVESRPLKQPDLLCAIGMDGCHECCPRASGGTMASLAASMSHRLGGPTKEAHSSIEPMKWQKSSKSRMMRTANRVKLTPCCPVDLTLSWCRRHSHGLREEGETHHMRGSCGRSWVAWR